MQFEFTFPHVATPPGPTIHTMNISDEILQDDNDDEYMDSDVQSVLDSSEDDESDIDVYYRDEILALEMTQRADVDD